jgi:hypothetical protein
MSYEVHITRKVRGWNDATDEAAISLAEWQAYVTGDPEMQADDFVNLTYRTSELTDWQLNGASVWVPYSKNGRHGRYARFVHQGDRVTVESPDEEMLGKMQAIAHALGACVQGEDGEYFDDYGAPLVAAPWASMEFRNFQTFASAEAAQPLLAALERAGIATTTAFDNGQLAFDPSFANNQLTSKFTVQLRLADFEHGSQVLADLDQDAISQANPNHYLFSASDEELFDLLVKPDEWSSFDVALASQLLRQRGRDISPDTLKLLRQRRVMELAQPDRDQNIWIGSGYASALLGGLLGIFIGYHLYSNRLQLPDGRRVYTFSAQDRVHGLRIMVLAVVMFVLLVGLRIFYTLGNN